MVAVVQNKGGDGVSVAERGSASEGKPEEERKNVPEPEPESPGDSNGR